VPRIITLTTDFGLEDAYVGVMKGVILGIAPLAAPVDISHAIRPQNIAEGTFVLLSAYAYFPGDTIHLAVIDPGVGTSRLPIAVETPHGTYVGPDNGLFGPVLTQQGVLDADGQVQSGARAVELANPSFRLPRTSKTFHGRDIFAPAAAHLAAGVPLDELGPRLSTLNPGAWPAPERGHGRVCGQIVHVDHFGNCISNIAAFMASPRAVIAVAGRAIGGLAETYQQGEIVALTGSTGLVEIALRNGSASDALGLRVGDTVEARDS
jgi:S-adenosylmethionine hydrolase